eukprot:g6874.t1
MNRSAAAALAAVSVLLSGLGSTPCAAAGRTHLRGGSESAAAPATAETQPLNNYSGRRIRGGRRLQATAETQRLNSYSSGKRIRGGRRLQATADAATPVAAGNNTPPPEPRCTTLLVPSMASAVTGSYTFHGRFSGGHPVYTDSATGNNIFYDSSNFYITQPSAQLFLSLETDVFEPDDLVGLQPWVRNNDPSCDGACTWNIRISCTTLTADVATATTTPAPTPATVVNTLDNNTNSTSYMTETTDIDGCMSLNIRNGADRTGVYVLNTNAADAAVLINGRPSYVGVGVNRTADQVFTVMMNVCATGYGVVDADWAARAGDLSANASAHAVFLMYVGQHPDGPGLASTAVCEVPVWFITSGDIDDLEAAGEYTFLSLSDVEDPSEATTWARFTPATTASRATLVETSWIDVGCADAKEVEEALEGNEEAGAGTGIGAGETAAAAEGLASVGSEPNGNGRRRLRGGGEALTPAGSESSGNGRRRLRGTR